MATTKVVSNPSLKQITYEVLLAALAEWGTEAETVGGKAVQVFTADPLDWADFPCIAINQLSDTETNSHIGDSLADELIEDENEVYAGIGAIFSQQVEVKLWTTNKDQRDRLGELLPVFLLAGRGTSYNPGLFVTTPGLSLVRISGGQDEGVSDTSGQLAPHAIYNRTYVLSATVEKTIQEPAGTPIEEIITQGTAVEFDPIAALETLLTEDPRESL